MTSPKEITKEQFDRDFSEADKATTREIEIKDAMSVYSNLSGVATIDHHQYLWWPSEAAAIDDSYGLTGDDVPYGIIILLSLGEDAEEVREWAIRRHGGDEVAGWSGMTAWLQDK